MVSDSRKIFTPQNPFVGQRPRKNSDLPQSHLGLAQLGRAIPVGRGQFFCATCGVSAGPTLRRLDDEILIVSKDCCHLWGTWREIEAMLDKEA